LLRAFAGRRRARATWSDQPAPSVATARASFTLGSLQIVVQPLGARAAGSNRPSAVFEVKVTGADEPRGWSSRYGFDPARATAEKAANAALDELDEIWRDPTTWEARLTAGMSEDETEAMLDSPAARLDLKSARWIGPHLDAARAERDARGAWF
jgi:hypothetical protein